jgi:hypothetical protein
LPIPEHLPLDMKAQCLNDMRMHLVDGVQHIPAINCKTASIFPVRLKRQVHHVY